MIAGVDSFIESFGGRQRSNINNQIICDSIRMIQWINHFNRITCDWIIWGEKKQFKYKKISRDSIQMILSRDFFLYF